MIIPSYFHHILKFFHFKKKISQESITLIPAEQRLGTWAQICAHVLFYLTNYVFNSFHLRISYVFSLVRQLFSAWHGLTIRYPTLNAAPKIAKYSWIRIRRPQWKCSTFVMHLRSNMPFRWQRKGLSLKERSRNAPNHTFNIKSQT